VIDPQDVPGLDELRQDTDAAKRIVDAVALALVVDFDQAIRSFMVFSLVDGTSDRTLYPSWNKACDYASKKADRHAPLKVTPDGINERDALLWLRAIRKMGFTFDTPEHVSSRGIYLPGGRKLRRRF